MARILICHVPKDGGLARDLGALLMGRGHFVSFDGDPDVPKEDRAQRLRQFEVVIVMWTDNSAQSAGLIEIASETLPLNILVPVRQESLSTTELPLKFRKLNMFAPRDIDGLARLIARLSHAQTSLREMTARDAMREASPPPPGPVYQRPTAPPAQRPQAAAPAEPPQKPPLPVFVKQRLPAAPTPAPAPPAPEAAPQAPAVPYAERPSFPPKVAKTAEPSAARVQDTTPLPPFVARRLSSASSAVVQPTAAEKPAPAREAQPHTPRAARPAPPVQSGHEQAWKALADELGEPAHPVVAPPITRPHAPYGRPPLTGRVAPPEPDPQQMPQPGPRARNETSPFASLRPQAQPATPPVASPVPPGAGRNGPPPPLPSRDGLGAGSPAFSAVAMAQHLARLVEAGLLLIYIPEATSLGEPITTEVRLGREVLDEAQGDPRSATDRILIDTLSVSLISDDPGFSIERQSERTQFVGQRFREHAAAHGNGRWVWLVTPHSPGDFDLIVRISALVRDRSGVPTPVALPDRRYSIAVHAREARAR